MKKVALIVLLVVMFVGAAVVSAAPQNGANRYVVANVKCDDGYDGQVLVPAAPAVRSFTRPIDTEEYNMN